MITNNQSLKFCKCIFCDKIFNCRGMYEIQPKCFINYTSIGGSKIKISVQPDPTRPSDLSVEYNTKTVFIAGEKMPGIKLSIF